MLFNPHLFFSDVWAILRVVPGTLLMALLVLVMSIIIGSLLSCLRMFGGRFTRRIPTLYVSYVRSMPMLIHIYILFQILQRMFPGQLLPQLVIVIIIYSFYVGASQTENIRAALRSVDKGQFEAGYSIGMTRTQTMLRVVFPQALMVAVPIFFNTYLSTIKGLALVFTVGVVDIFAQAKLLGVENFGYIEAYLAAALIYWGISIIFTFVFHYLEKYFTRQGGARGGQGTRR
ncbi:amino acid ABC transporter permease [Brenneria corticis]|nr:amino acid ABC transporter permease [Brenneria sp. CFCC 11842]